MKILQIVLTIVSSLAYLATAIMAISAFFRLRRLCKDMDEMKSCMGNVVRLSLVNHVRDSFREVNEMKETLSHLVESERFEEADKLKDVISKAEENARRALDELNKDGSRGIVMEF